MFEPTEIPANDKISAMYTAVSLFMFGNAKSELEVAPRENVNAR